VAACVQGSGSSSDAHCSHVRQQWDTMNAFVYTEANEVLVQGTQQALAAWLAVVAILISQISMQDVFFCMSWRPSNC
jgi:hypothetical protein